MIDSYQDFLLEGKIEQAINENNLVASDGFLEKLKAMSKSSKIAEILFTLFNDNEYISANLAQNWVDITPVEDTISFLSDVKADKIFGNRYEAKGRSTVKIGRFVNAILNNSLIKKIVEEEFNITKKFSDKEVEEFVNLYKSINVDESKKFKLVKGKSIAEYYDEEAYANGKGTLGNSCMRNVNPEYFDMYVENDKICRLLVYLDGEGKLLGRALVWKLHEGPSDAQYFMDRIYVSSDSDIIKFKKYAEDQGWMYKYRNASDAEEGLMFKYKDELFFGRIYVKLKSADFNKYPFLDTLSFLDEGDKLLSNVGFKEGSVLCSTNGNADECDACNGNGKEFCYTCDNTGEMDCEDCNGDGKINCDNCQGDGKVENDNGKEIKCKECNGKGEFECETCDGKGTVECDNCEGKSCPECVGLEDSVIQRIKEGEWKEFKSVISST